jgi:hypothetical protein
VSRSRPSLSSSAALSTRPPRGWGARSTTSHELGCPCDDVICRTTHGRGAHATRDLRVGWGAHATKTRPSRGLGCPCDKTTEGGSVPSTACRGALNTGPSRGSRRARRAPGSPTWKPRGERRRPFEQRAVAAGRDAPAARRKHSTAAVAEMAAPRRRAVHQPSRARGSNRVRIELQELGFHPFRRDVVVSIEARRRPARRR